MKKLVQVIAAAMASAVIPAFAQAVTPQAQDTMVAATQPAGSAPDGGQADINPGITRRVAAANANIGVAKAAFFPDVTLELDGGYQSDTFSPWLAAPDEIWSIGPQLMFTLFDGGRRRAAVAVARAKLAENGANYRETVLAAFQQVEDELALLHHLGDASRNEDEALASAQSTLALAMSRYRDGAVSHLNVVTAQTTELHAQISSLDLRTRRLTASVGLIQALGGGWS